MIGLFGPLSLWERSSGGVIPPAPPSGGFAVGGGGGKDENLDELELFKRLQRKLKAGVSLAQALEEENEEDVETVQEIIPAKVEKKEFKRRDPTVLHWVAARVVVLERRIEQYRREQEEEEEVLNLLIHLL